MKGGRKRERDVNSETKRERERKREERERKWNRPRAIRKKLEVETEGKTERAGRKREKTLKQLVNEKEKANDKDNLLRERETDREIGFLTGAQVYRFGPFW